jgi:alanyl-tRNA synthetase
MVEKLVNRQIRACLPVATELKAINEAKKAGAVALFGEKYGEEVRVVSIGDYSMELCGGTHLQNTGEIGFCKITSETSIAAGIRRIEAVTGEQAERYFQTLEDEINEIARQLHSQRSLILERIQKITEEHKQLQLELQKLQKKDRKDFINEIVENASKWNDIYLVKAKVAISKPNELREMGDTVKQKLRSGIGIFFAEINEKVTILVVVTLDLSKQYHAGKIAGKLAEIVGGKGGGRPDMAMAGGKETENIPKALEKVESILSEMAK